MKLHPHNTKDFTNTVATMKTIVMILLILYVTLSTTTVSAYVRSPKSISYAKPQVADRNSKNFRASQMSRPGLMMMSAPEVGSQNLDWKSLQFEYMRTRSFAKCVYKDGKWGETELVTGEPYIPMHIGATALHYGQSCFEGLKAFTSKDNKVRIFRPDENARRMQESCERICMAPFPQDRFIQACKDIVKDNIDFVPPYGTGGSLYIRPILFGSGARIGLG